MKAFDLGQLKMTARINDNQVMKSYSQIHKSPIKTSLAEGESYYLGGWGRSFDQNQQTWANIGQGIIQVGVGEEHAVILNNKNQCFAYGSNSYGQLALEKETVCNWPMPIGCFKDMKIVAVAVGSYHSFFQNSRGQIYGCGFNIKGQLGIGTYQNRKKPALVYTLLPNGIKNPRSNFVIESAEYKKKVKRSRHSLSELSNITSLLLKLENQENNKEPSFHLKTDQSVIKIVCGPLHSAALTNKNRLFVCGYNDKYNLGLGTKGNFPQFTQVKVKAGKIERLSAGIKMLGFISNGKPYLTGTLGSRVYQTFTTISIGQQIIDLKIGQRMVVMLSRSGNLYQLGDTFSKMIFDLPKKVESVGPIKAIYAGFNCFFANSDKLIYGWGCNIHNCVSGLEDEAVIETPKLLKIPICIHQNMAIVCGNGTTFLLSLKPLSIEEASVASKQLFEEELSIEMVQKTEKPKMKSSCTKNTGSNICGTQEKGMLQSMGLQPRMFNCNMEIQFSQLAFESQISEGGYGIIYRGIWRETVVAIKIFKIQSESAVKDFFSQCAAMEALRHPNIVMFLGACTKPPNFAIVLEYCGKGSLWSTIQNYEKNISWQQRRKYALDTARGVNYLHSCNPPILHRDLKSLNLLIDDSERVKLADFGWTKGLDEYMTGKIGTYQWMAPQVIAGQKYTQKADVFSYGIILWQIASRQPPFKHLSGLQVSMQVLNSDLRPPIPKKCPESFIKLMKKCWDREPHRRPHFKDIIKQLQVMKL